MVQAVILDVDGVIVGGKEGFNFANPHAEIVPSFKTIHEKGMPLVLCTGKFVYAIKDFVIAAHLDNPHIADGGAIIIDPVATLCPNDNCMVLTDNGSPIYKDENHLRAFYVKQYISYIDIAVKTSDN